MKKRVKKCACCGEELDQEGNCVNNCTDDQNYGFAEGVSWDEDDVQEESLRVGFCLDCNAKIPKGWKKCPNGCFGE